MDNAPIRSDYCSNFRYTKVKWCVVSLVRLQRKTGWEFNDKLFPHVRTVYLLELKRDVFEETNFSKTCWNLLSLEAQKTVSQPIVEEWATSIVPLLRSVSMKPKTCGVTPKHAPYASIVFRPKLTKPQKWSSQLMETKNVTSGIRNLNMKETSRSGIFNWETQKERKNRKNVWYSKTSAIVRTYWIPKSSEDWKKDEIETT